MAFPIQWHSLRCSSEKVIFFIGTSDVAQSRRSPPLAKIDRSSKGNVAAIAPIFGASNRSTSRSVIRSSTNTPSSHWEEFLKPLPTSSPRLSDVLWPSAGAFAAMAALGMLDVMVAHRGISFTTAPLGAVCAVLFSAPNSPPAQKYNMFVAQIGCATIGVLALSIFGPGWLARATALAASLAFMTVTGSIHPPGATGCLLICFIQEMVTFLKNNCRF